MAAYIPASEFGGFLGIPGIFEFTNHDGRNVRANCGQAASATAITHFGQQYQAQPESTLQLIMPEIERKFPPNILFGLFGTSRKQVERILRHYGLTPDEVRGEEELKARLRDRQPVLIMMGVEGGRFLNWKLPGGHWVVAYGFDEEHLFLTNWGRITWEEFRIAWNGLVPKLINMHGKGLCPVIK